VVAVVVRVGMVVGVCGYGGGGCVGVVGGCVWWWWVWGG